MTELEPHSPTQNSVKTSACCEWHNRNCEPPGELCCERCTEFHHGMHTCRGRLAQSHHDGSACVLDGAP